MYKCSVFLLSLSLLSLLSPTLAGPACARRLKNTSDCRAKCAQKWGWPGTTFGMDPWGAVLSPSSSSNANTPLMPTFACGASSLGVSGGASQGPSNSSTPAVNPESNPSPDSSSEAAPLYTTVYPSPSVSKGTSSSHSRTSSKSFTHTSPTHTSQPSTNEQPTTIPAPPPPQPHTTTTSSPKHTTTQAPPPSNPPSSGGGSSASSNDISQFLEFHNTIRAKHGATPLTWSNEAAGKAQQWANNCQFHHSGGSLGPFGENLAAGTGSGYGIQQGVEDWTNEVSSYDPNNPQPSHFTQVVWKGTTQVGCAQQSCNGIFDASFGPANYIVCEYSPQGNIIGEFPQNVQA